MTAFLQWKPQIFVDAHEMGPDSSYYFDPATDPYNPHTLPRQRDWHAKIGRQHAHELLYEICMRAVEQQTPLKRLLLADPRVAAHLSEGDLDELLDPARYTGLAIELARRGTGADGARAR